MFTEDWWAEVRMTGGPERIYDDAPTDPIPHRYPLGFAPRAPQHVDAPILWDGDQA